MTKSLIINYSEADESVLMGIFKKFKVKIQPVETEKDYGDKGVPQHVADNIIEGLKWIKKVERGEAEPITWEQMMAELEADEAVEEGDLVLTSGLGGGYPPDLIIGQVVNVRSRDFDLFQRATVFLTLNLIKRRPCDFISTRTIQHQLFSCDVSTNGFLFAANDRADN